MKGIYWFLEMKKLDMNKLQKPVDLWSSDVTRTKFISHRLWLCHPWSWFHPQVGHLSGPQHGYTSTALARPDLHFQISQEKKDFADLIAETKAFRAELALNGPHPEIITGSVHWLTWGTRGEAHLPEHGGCKESSLIL